MSAKYLDYDSFMDWEGILLRGQLYKQTRYDEAYHLLNSLVKEEQPKQQQK